MISSIIFSKNRPLQLDLCLNSVSQNFTDCDDIVVIYKADAEYKDSYENIKIEHKNALLVEQKESLFKQVLNLIECSKNDFICFFTDDNIVYNKVPSINKNILDEPKICCFSLRMGLNITERHHENKIFEDQPSFFNEIYDNYIVWPRTANPYGSYWSYSMSVDGHIFKKRRIRKILEEICYLNQKYKDWEQTPNTLESIMQRFWAEDGPLMASFKESVVVNSPNNKVQNSHDNNFGQNFNLDAETLLDRFILGRRINPSKINFKKIKCPHTEINILSGLE